MSSMHGYLRADGRKGIRNVVAVVYLVECAHHVAAGCETASERLGHREFVLTYKSFEPIGPACLPA